MTITAVMILPQSFFDSLSALWGGCAYVGSAIVAAGLVFQVVTKRPEAAAFIWLLTKIFIIGMSTVFIREWLMRLNDIVIAFGQMMNVSPLQVDDQFVSFLSGNTSSGNSASVWDVIWGTKSLGTAISYALLWMFGWLAWSVQYVVKLIGDVLLLAGWALSPIFLSFFMLRPMTAVAHKYIIGLVALVFWPFGWVLASVVTKAMLQAASVASLIPVAVSGTAVAPVLTVLLVGTWIIVSSFLAPWVTTRVLLMGANPASTFARGVGSVGQSAFAGATGAAVTAATGGAAAPAVIAAAATAALASGTESAARGGGTARASRTVIGGWAGMNAARNMRRSTLANEMLAMAEIRRAATAERMANASSQTDRQQRRSRSGFDYQPHDDDPNRTANEIDSRDKP